MKRFPVGKYLLRFLLLAALIYLTVYTGSTFLEALK